MRVAFVVQRYGLKVNGGAELHCRWIAELMKDTWEIEVLTTCALDHITWANYYSGGREKLHGVHLHRFPVAVERNIDEFNRLCAKVFRKRHTLEDEIEWMKAQGPNVPGLTEHILNHKQDFDAFIFFTYLYGTTFWTLPLVKEKAFLVPNAHDEPPIYLSIFKELFCKPRGFIFNTPEEKIIVQSLFDIDCSQSDIIGVGIKFDSSFLKSASSALELPKNYILYVGRIDQSKGCDELFGFWESYKKSRTNDLILLLIGKSNMELPKRKDLVFLGFVSEAEKYFAMSRARCLIVPSKFESLSLVIMESWLCGRPVLVNGRSAVLMGQCQRSNGGLWYENFEEFEACLDFILFNEKIGRKMAKNGKKYVNENYDWTVIKKKYLQLITP